MNPATKSTASGRTGRRRAAFARKRKNFLPTFILAILFWCGWGWLVYSIPPDSSFIIAVFYLLLFLAVFLTSSLFFANSRRGLLLAVWLISFLFFRYHGLGNYLNLLLLTGILVSLELYFHQH